MLLAQIPGAEEAIKAAAKSGWLETFVVVASIFIIGSFSWVIKRILDDGKSREDRIDSRLTKLETEDRVVLVNQLKINSEIMSQVVVASEKMSLAADRMISSLDRFTTILESRPCLLTIINHGKFLSKLSEFEEVASKEGI